MCENAVELKRIACALELIASVLVEETKIGGAFNVQDIRRTLRSA